MSKRYFIMVAGAFALCLAAMVASGDLSHLKMVVNIPSLIIVLVIPFLLSLSSFTLKEGHRAFRAAFKASEASRRELELALVFFRALRRYFSLSGIFGFFSGIIAMLMNLKDPGFIGWGVALSLLTVYYVLILELLLVVPFQTGIKKQLTLGAEV